MPRAAGVQPRCRERGKEGGVLEARRCRIKREGNLKLDRWPAGMFYMT
jgi:hypothetical protein